MEMLIAGTAEPEHTSLVIGSLPLLLMIRKPAFVAYDNKASMYSSVIRSIMHQRTSSVVHAENNDEKSVEI